MNPTERLAIWQHHLAAAQASLASVGERFSGLGQAEQAKLRHNWQGMVATAQGFIKFYEEKLETA